MSRPAEIRSSSSPFVKKDNRHGQKLGLDTERLDQSYNHKFNDEAIYEELRELRIKLIAAERLGKFSRAKKIRREMNHLQEQALFLRHSWCFGCYEVLHNCRCSGLRES